MSPILTKQPEMRPDEVLIKVKGIGGVAQFLPSCEKVLDHGQLSPSLVTRSALGLMAVVV